MTLSTFLIVAFLILVNALYVAAEFAIVGARATRVERLAGQGHRLAGALLPILRDTLRLDRYIAACQIGITASSLSSAPSDRRPSGSPWAPPWSPTLVSSRSAPTPCRPPSPWWH